MFGFGEAINRLNDLDWGWWPFLALRPGKDQEMSHTFVAKLSLRLGGFYAPLLFLLLAAARIPLDWRWAVGTMAASVVVFFCVYRVTFAAAWNGRARWLAARRRN